MKAVLAAEGGAQVEGRYVNSDPPAEGGEAWARLRLVRGMVTRLDREVAAGFVLRSAGAGASTGTGAGGGGAAAFQGVLGHTAVGEVESVDGGTSPGKGRAGASGRPSDLVGRRVLVAPHVACRSCDMCRSGLRLHCRQRRMLGICGLDGCLSERFAAPAENLLTVPDDLDDDIAVFGSIVAAGVQAVRQLTIEGKPYITVLGDGPVALVCAQLMARLNASVRVIGRHLHKLAVCERWGIKHRPLSEIGRRADQDIVVDCTGRPSGLSAALELVRPRGQILSKSLMVDRGGTDDRAGHLSRLVAGEVTLLGSGFGPMSEALSLLARREVDVLGLIDRRCRLADAAGMFRVADFSPLSVLIEP